MRDRRRVAAVPRRTARGWRFQGLGVLVAFALLSRRRSGLRGRDALRYGGEGERARETERRDIFRDETEWECNIRGKRTGTGPSVSWCCQLVRTYVSRVGLDLALS